MKKISGFSFVHNAIDGGYPIVEAVRAIEPYVDEVIVVDAESTDGTKDLLFRLGVDVIETEWGNEAGETLKRLHAYNTSCKHDLILHFEADEVFSDRLLCNLFQMIDHEGLNMAAVHRIQVEQNFQRVREYPIPVHRLFPKGSVEKDGRTTNVHLETPMRVKELSPDYGMLWDITNCFRDTWINRCKQNAELWNNKPTYKAVGKHAATGFGKYASYCSEDYFLDGEHWEWETTPLDVPRMVKGLVGQTKYKPRI